ncbi:hypothetical protein INR49_029086 [Caranx melampygus]|nr:hypothetical protein INR49_029086 [Caranx melampygus]
MAFLGLGGGRGRQPKSNYFFFIIIIIIIIIISNNQTIINLPFLIIEKQRLRASLQRQLLCTSLSVEHNNENHCE